MAKFSEFKGKLNIENPEIAKARSDIEQMASASKRKLRKISGSQSIDEMLESKTADLHKERQEFLENRGREIEELSRESDATSVYQAKKAVVEHVEKPKRRESFISRLLRYFKERGEARKEMKGVSWYSSERKRAVYTRIFRDCFEPQCNAWSKLADTTWNFMCRFANDFVRLLLFIGDLFIKAGYYIYAVFQAIEELYWSARYRLEKHKGELFTGFATLVVMSALVMVVISSITTYEYSYYGKPLGIVKSKKDVYDAIEVLGEKLSEASGANVSLDVERDIEFKRIWGKSEECSSDEDILNTITYMRDIQVRAYAIELDGKQTVVLKDEASAKRVLDSIQNEYAGKSDGVEYTDMRFAQVINVEEVGAQIGDIRSEDEAKRYLQTGSTDPDYEGKANPLIVMYTTERASYSEQINYGTRYISNPNLYIDETEVVSAGVYGQRDIVATITRINGEETSRTIVSSEVVSEPVDEVLYQGTKPVPVREGTGVFQYPLKSYTMTSKFGMRWGRMHTGVDLANSTGTKIYAADGGTVTFAGWKGTYGYTVVIDHGSFYSTLYAHCSKVLVNAGDQVYQGQNIALVGSTGHSTGPHLHFEVRYKDSPVNPLNYL